MGAGGQNRLLWLLFLARRLSGFARAVGPLHAHGRCLTAIRRGQNRPNAVPFVTFYQTILPTLRGGPQTNLTETCSNRRLRMSCSRFDRSNVGANFFQTRAGLLRRTVEALNVKWFALVAELKRRITSFGVHIPE